MENYVEDVSSSFYSKNKKKQMDYFTKQYLSTNVFGLVISQTGIIFFSAPAK